MILIDDSIPLPPSSMMYKGINIFELQCGTTPLANHTGTRPPGAHRPRNITRTDWIHR